MRRIFLIISVFFILISCQNKLSEEEKVESTLKSIFESFDNPDFESFKNISAEKIFCKMCFENPNFSEEPYKTDREYFFNNFIHILPELESFKKAKEFSEFKIVTGSNEWSDITAYLTIWKKGELGKDHEGEQIGIYLKKENGQLKFSGIESIP